MSSQHDNAILLTDLAVVAITGPDAVNFLQSQLTNDVAALGENNACLAGYCTPKGRLLGSLVLWRHPANSEDLYALIKADIAESVVKRLSMYVLRAKARLVITPLQAWGMTSDNTQTLDADLPQSPAAYTVIQDGKDSWIATPLAENAPVRWWRVAGTSEWKPDPAAPATPPLRMPATGPANAGSAAQAAQETVAASQEDSNQQANPELLGWQAADIAAGLPWVVTSTQDLFIPQTLNLDLIQGVSFTKGCYPGQEVVARSHYRGTVKRRMAYGVAETSVLSDAAPATDIFDANKPANPVGRVINAAQKNDQVHVLMEVQLADLDNADFRLGSASGPTIKYHALPYSITAE